MPNDYGILNGADIEWNDYRQKMVWDALLWVGCIALPFLLWLVLRTKSRAVLLYGACALLGVQVLATGITCLTTDFSQSAVSDAYLSDDGLYDVSKEGNVIIFILDAFDQRFFDEAYEDDPTFVDFLDGFTYFNNATSHYPATRGSLPFLLTNQYYENKEPHGEYFQRAWSDASESYYQPMMDDGYDIGLYIGLEDLDIQRDIALTPWVENAVQDSLKVSSYVGLETALTQFTAMRFLPDGLKRYVWSQDDLFVDLKGAKPGKAEVYDWESVNFYEKLISQKLSVTEGKKYKFIHFDGTHAPSTIMEDLTEDKTGRASSFTEARGELNIIREYIRQLKELGVYDQTCLIVAADHGYNETVKTNPILMVKGFGDKGALAFTDVPVAHSNLFATVLSELGEPVPEEYGESVYDVPADSQVIRRYFQYELEGKQGGVYFPDMIEYNILPDNNDKGSYILTGNIFTPDGIIHNRPYMCDVGVPIEFTSSEALSYFVYGLGYLNDFTLAWSTGESARACFNFGEVENDLTARITIHDWVPNGVQHVTISSEDQVLFDGDIISGTTQINFAVPKACVRDGMLTLDFKYPNAISPIELGTNKKDVREMCIAFKEILFTEQEPTEAIDFTNAGNANDHFFSGWYVPENDQTWTSETASILAVLPGEDRQQMTVTYWTHPGAKDTAVYYNGERIGVLPHHEETASETIDLPEEYRADGDGQVVTFVTDGATSSKEYYGGDETDERILGIAVSEISFKPADVVGRTISFEDGEALYYFTAGTEDYLEAGGLWTVGKHCRARFYVAEPEKDLLCHIELHDWMPGGKQRVQITCGSDVLYDGTVSNSMPYINFVVPRTCAADGYLDMRISLPNACAPKSLGESEEERELGVRFKAIRFEELEETESIDFTQGGDSWGHVLSGWYAQEADFRWSDERASILAVLPGEDRQQMTVTYWTHPGAEDTEVYYNGERIGTLPHHEETADETIDLPEGYRVDGDGQVVTFVTDGATSSKEYYGGDETDSRILGIAVSEISFKPADVVGRTISFEDGEALSYFIAGTEDFLEDGGLWTVDKHCRARFYVAEPEKDLLCRIELHDWMPGGKQRVQVTCGDAVLYDGTVSNSMPYINFAVPRDCAADGCIELDFALPDACVPKSLGESEEERELGVRFKAIRFEELEETESIDFAQGGDSWGHVLSGWYAQEADFRWSDERASVMAILPEGQGQMTVTYWTHPGAEDTEVYYNGERIGVLPHHDDFADETIILPEEYRVDGEVQTVTFVTDGATSSKEYYGGDETDERILGIAVSAISFKS